MTSVTKVAGRVFAGAAVSLAMVSLTQAATITVNDEAPLTIVSPGFSYAASGGLSSQLSVATQGYLFCANVILQDQDPSVVTLASSHSRWTLPQAFIIDFSYTGGELHVNRASDGHSIPSTLACHARGPQGEVFNPYSAFGTYIFRNGYEGVEETQYSNMVNWQPVAGFDWAQPDWAQVPTDSCQFDMTPADLPHLEENALCAAATGVRPGGGAFGTRAPTMWTTTTDGGTKFVYLARLDLRLGAQQANEANSQFLTPQNLDGMEGVPSTLSFQLRDGFDSEYLTDAGTYCFLDALPATLTSSVCSGAQVSGSVNGVFKYEVALSFLSAPALSRYVAVVRSTTSNFPSIHTPIAAMAIMSEPSTSREEQGDAFIGDNVIFGFPGSNDGFPWMTQ